MSPADVVSVLLVALGLSADCFAVALCGSLSGRLNRLQILRASLAFGFFQAAMCLLGWLAGTTVIDLISGYDHWIAFGLLALVGGHMVWESLRAEGEVHRDVTHGWQLLILSLATSIDALAVGLSFGVLQTNIALASGIIGATALLVSVLGFNIGRRVGGLIGRRAETVGGIVLILIGLRILLTDLL